MGWAKAGIKFVVTPGRRYFARDAKGVLIGAQERVRNGQFGHSGLMYLVRDDYMEPALGHQAERRGGGSRGPIGSWPPYTARDTPISSEPGPQLDHALKEVERLLEMTLARFSRCPVHVDWRAR